MTLPIRKTLIAAAVAALAVPVAAQQMQGGSGGRDAQSGWMMGRGMMGQGMMGQGMMMQPGMMGQGMMGQGMMMGPGMMGGGPGRHIEGRLAFLKTELGITPEQEEEWNAYADAMRESVASMQAMHDQMMSGDGMPETLPERMELHEQMMSLRLSTLSNLREAAVPLYESLNDEQRQTAEELMGMM